MKRLIFVLAGACALVGAGAAYAETISDHHGVITTSRTEQHGKQIDKITCREFLGLEQQFQPQAISYAIGYDKAKKPEDAVFDVSGISRIVPVVQKSCKTTPQLTLLQRIRADLRRFY
jgi:acid stress chaperone HdeA